MKLIDAIDEVFSHNEIIEIYIPDESDTHYSKRIWRGMAHALPMEYLRSEDWRIFGCVREELWHSDSICICLKDYKEEGK